MWSGCSGNFNGRASDASSPNGLVDRKSRHVLLHCHQMTFGPDIHSRKPPRSSSVLHQVPCAVELEIG